MNHKYLLSRIQVAGEDKVYRDIYEVSNLEGKLAIFKRFQLILLKHDMLNMSN